MRRRHLLPLGLLPVVLAVTPGASEACTVTMGGTGYPSIQAAVAVAPMIATVQVDGSTGTCNENVLIPNVTLRMILSGMNGATISGAAGSPTVDARVKGFLIQGFTVTGGNRGIQLQRNANAIVDTVTVQNTGGEGIVIDSMAFAVITNSTIRNNPGTGIKVMELANARIGANLPEDGGAAAPNTISGNAGDGINVSDKATAQVIGNTIIGNGGNGIGIASSSSASTAGNLINGNMLSGIAASERSYVSLGTQAALAEPDTTTAGNMRFGVACSSAAVVTGFMNSSRPVTGSLSQFGPAADAFAATCPRQATGLTAIASGDLASAPVASAINAYFQSGHQFTLTAHDPYGNTLVWQESDVYNSGVALFNGVAANSTTKTINVTRNGQPFTSGVGTAYYTLNPYRRLGSVSSDGTQYEVTQSDIPLPPTLSVGQSGDLDSGTLYHDRTMAAVDGPIFDTYMVIADSAAALRFCDTSVFTANPGNVDGLINTTYVTCYSVDASGNAIVKSISASNPPGGITLVYQ